ncbi:hypothetical protein LJE82_12995, partial [bacterium BMS3Abin03]|nr:hypothetical protein [bacterium BMS3Abin03]
MRTKNLFKTVPAVILTFILFLSACSSPNEPEDTQKTAYIKLDETHQVIRGFGAANILPWRPDMT